MIFSRTLVKKSNIKLYSITDISEKNIQQLISLGSHPVQMHRQLEGSRHIYVTCGKMSRKSQI